MIHIEQAQDLLTTLITAMCSPDSILPEKAILNTVWVVSDLLREHVASLTPSDLAAVV